uniref:Sec-independent protein translocase protein TATA, chloroplastic-like n=1 Tax=Nicotiana tabacum TaxID=4097 RepID=A0A1S3XHE6_TOBAC
MTIISYSAAAATAKAISCSSVSVSTAKIATLCSSGSLFFNSKRALFLGPAITTRKVTSSSSGKKGLSCNCLFWLGVLELVVIAALVFGPNQLPEVSRTIGNTDKSFQQVTFS